MAMGLDIRTLLAGPAVQAVFALLVAPFGIGVLDTRLMTPLALPGYLLFVSMTVVGDYLVPRFGFVVYWVPFLGSCYGLSVLLGGSYRAIRRRLDDQRS